MITSIVSLPGAKGAASDLPVAALGPGHVGTLQKPPQGSPNIRMNKKIGHDPLPVS